MYTVYYFLDIDCGTNPGKLGRSSLLTVEERRQETRWLITWVRIAELTIHAVLVFIVHVQNKQYIYMYCEGKCSAFKFVAL